MDDLIDTLVSDLRPTDKGALGRRLMLATVVGLVISALLLFSVHGLRPDMLTAVYLPVFWVKSVYPLALAATGLHALMIVSRPGGFPRLQALMAFIVYLAVFVLGLLQLHASPAQNYPTLIFGISYWFCPLIIIAAAIPMFAGCIWFLRRGAPTNLRLAGFTAGMASGAIGAWVYSWACIENGLTFVATWYTLGIVLCGVLGGLSGRWLLRW